MGVVLHQRHRGPLHSDLRRVHKVKSPRNFVSKSSSVDGSFLRDFTCCRRHPKRRPERHRLSFFSMSSPSRRFDFTQPVDGIPYPYCPSVS